jgi:FixH
MNWGNKLLITFLVFGGGILWLVYRSMNAKFELVEKDYYKSELRYQDVIDASNHANALATSVKIEQANGRVLLQLPEEMKGQRITGTVLFYCDYNSDQDRKFSLNVDANADQVFEKGALLPGNYLVKISWNANKTNYYTEKLMTIN